MKHINYTLLLMSVSFLYALLITINSPLTIQTQSWVYATEQEDDNNQEEAQSSTENEDTPDESNGESESSQGTTDSDQSEGNSNTNDDNDVSSTNQNTPCSNITQFSNLPLYIGQDGCQYPCPSPDSNDENNIPEGCPLEPSTSQTPSQEQQQNGQDNSNQYTFVNPSLNSDTSTAVSNNEATPTTTQKSFTPAGKLRGGPTQTESSIPLLSNDVSKPKPSDSGSVGVEGTTLVPPSQSESSRPSLPGEPSKPFDPSKPFTPTKPFTSGSQTSPIFEFQGDARLIVYSNFTNAKSPFIPKYCISTISSPAIKFIQNEAQANPYCVYADLSGTFHNVRAPGLVEIKIIDSNFNTVNNYCKFYIYPKESKSCLLDFINK